MADYFYSLEVLLYEEVFNMPDTDEFHTWCRHFDNLLEIANENNM